MLNIRANCSMVNLTGDDENRSNKRAPDSLKRGLYYYRIYAQKVWECGPQNGRRKCQKQSKAGLLLQSGLHYIKIFKQERGEI
jgi:hypothetical protein